MTLRPTFRQTARGALTMVLGASSAQLLPVLFIPVVTRLYTPGEFGGFALFLAFVIPLSLVSTGRYDMSIMVASENNDAHILTRLSGAIAVGFSLLLFVAGVAASFAYADGEERSAMIGYCAIGAVAVALSGLFSSWSYLLIREAQTRRASLALVLRGAGLVLLQILFGLGGMGTAGLTIAYALAPIIGVLALIGIPEVTSRSGTRSELSRPQSRFGLLRQYRDFPLFTAPAALINNGTLSITTLLMGSTFGASTLGQYALVQRTLGMPTVLAGQSLGQIFFRDASREFAQTGRATRSARNSTILLAALTVPLFTVVYFASPALFPIVFGSEWEEAGRFAQIMAPAFAIRLVASPLSVANQATGNNRFGLAANTLLLLLTIIAWAACLQGSFSADAVLWVLTGLQVIFYSLFLTETLRRCR